MIRTHMAQNFDEHKGFTQHNLLRMLVPEVDGNERKYNFVVTPNELIVISNSVYYGFVDWILSKHVLISGYSHDVRYAGELWKDENDIIHLNNNSGTYRPTVEQLQNVAQLAHLLFPDLNIVTADPQVFEPEKEEAEPEPQPEAEPEEDSGWSFFGFLLGSSTPKTDEEEVVEARQSLSMSRHIRPLNTKGQ